MSDEDDDRAHCVVCGVLPGDDGGRWVLLNRWAFGAGSGKCYTHRLDEDGDELWDPDDDCAAGAVACFPGCLVAYVEGRMHEVQVELDAGAGS